MEAVTFRHYLETQTLLTYEGAREAVPAGVHLTEDDYVLGVCDLVGEMMRFGVTRMATEGVLPRGKGGRDILRDLREVRVGFEGLDLGSGVGGGSSLRREVGKKMEVMRSSVEKVENAVYGMIVRGRERPKGWMPDLEGEERGREAGESY